MLDFISPHRNRSAPVFHDDSLPLNVTDRLEILAVNRDAYAQILNLIAYDLETQQFQRAAGRIAWAAQFQDHCGIFSSPRLEEFLVQLGKEVFARPLNASMASRTRQRVWHITTEVESVGGHSRAITRWIQNDQQREYNLLLTRQQKSIPEDTRDAISKSGGRIHVCASGANTLDISKELHKVLDGTANVVVLQMYSGDISGLLPFCRPGGPLVVTYNTADHKPFLGVSISDLVVEIRDSGQACTQRFRGTNRTALLPLAVDRGVGRTSETKHDARNRLGIAKDQICVLSIGSAYKYRPIENLDFHKAAGEIAKQNERVCICVVGPDSSPAWDRLSGLTQGRVKVFGKQESVTLFYNAADIYIEGFPFGSLTALLDARAHGLPCVIAPKPVEPPFCSDSPGIRDLTQPESVNAYVDAIGKLCDVITPEHQSGHSPGMSLHWGHRWTQSIENVFKSLPSEHHLYRPSVLETPSSFVETFWSKFTCPSDIDAAAGCGWSQLVLELSDNNATETATFLPQFSDAAIASILDRVRSAELRSSAIESLLQNIMTVGQTSRCSISWNNFIRLSLHHPRHAFRAFQPRFPFMSLAGI